MADSDVDIITDLPTTCVFTLCHVTEACAATGNLDRSAACLTDAKSRPKCLAGREGVYGFSRTAGIVTLFCCAGELGNAVSDTHYSSCTQGVLKTLFMPKIF